MRRHGLPRKLRAGKLGQPRVRRAKAASTEQFATLLMHEVHEILQSARARWLSAILGSKYVGRVDTLLGNKPRKLVGQMMRSRALLQNPVIIIV